MTAAAPKSLADATMIAPDDDFDGAPILRKSFRLDIGHGAVVGASLALSALGVCEPRVNGTLVSDDVLTPGWTSYEWRLRYAEYDVTELISQESVLSVALGNGWYRGHLGWNERSSLYGDELGAIAALTVTFADGHRQQVLTDESWTAHPSATTANDLYDGQTIDARRRTLDHWWKADAVLTDGVGVHPLSFDHETLEPYIGPGVRRQQHIAPERIWLSPSGRVLVDFGQNLVGWIRTEVTGWPGETITIRHAEVLEHDELGTRPLRNAEATDRFITTGERDVFEPTFTFHGFRYAEVQNWPGGIDALRRNGGITAVVIGSDFERTGSFRTSDPLLNQLHDNVVWGMRGNFVDVPTDCPQRDERLGWTGDISVFAPSALFLGDVAPFLRDWLRDLAVEQTHHDDIVPFVVPDALKLFAPPEFPAQESTAIWGDAAVWVPWAIWTATGDRTVLDDQYDSMLRHARRVGTLLSPTGLWDQGMQFGDWLDPDAPPEAPHLGKTDPGVVATVCAYRTARLVAATADVLGDTDAVDEFHELAARIRSGFSGHYVDAGVITSDTVTAYALAIVFDILDADDRAVASDRLADLVRAAGHHISTGFAGTPFVTDALSSTGHLDDAYGLLLQTECPSWLYPVTMGATTVWERWDSMLPDGTINPGGMTSFNHYALGAVVDWMHRVVGGVHALEPGYRTVLVAPQPGGGLTWCDTELQSAAGRVHVRWDIVDDTLVVRADVPAGSAAVLRLPGRPDEHVGAGTHDRTVPRAREGVLR